MTWNLSKDSTSSQISTLYVFDWSKLVRLWPQQSCITASIIIRYPSRNKVIAGYETDNGLLAQATPIWDHKHRWPIWFSALLHQCSDCSVRWWRASVQPGHEASSEATCLPQYSQFVILPLHSVSSHSSSSSLFERRDCGIEHVGVSDQCSELAYRAWPTP